MHPNNKYFMDANTRANMSNAKNVPVKSKARQKMILLNHGKICSPKKHTQNHDDGLAHNVCRRRAESNGARTDSEHIRRNDGRDSLAK